MFFAYAHVTYCVARVRLPVSMRIFFLFFQSVDWSTTDVFPRFSYLVLYRRYNYTGLLSKFWLFDTHNTFLYLSFRYGPMEFFVVSRRMTYRVPYVLVFILDCSVKIFLT